MAAGVPPGETVPSALQRRGCRAEPRRSGCLVVAIGGGPDGLRLRELSVVDDGDQVVIGDPQSGRFVAVPPVGGVVTGWLPGPLYASC